MSDADKIYEFPSTDEEKRAFRKAQQDEERKRLVNAFVRTERTEQLHETPTCSGLYHTPHGEPFADLIDLKGCRETWPVRSQQFKIALIQYLKHKADEIAKENPLAGALFEALLLDKKRVNESIDEFEMQAIASDEREVYLRVAGDSGDLYIDLCNSDWSAIRVTGAGWQVVDAPDPIRFRRTRGMSELPFPQHGTIDALRPFLNIRDERDFVLVVAFILAALRNRGPYPVLVLQGEQGTAKSTFARIVRSLIDPSSVPLSALPPSGRDLFIAAKNAHLMSFENISKLSDRLSDNLCQLATGGGFRIRRLYTDADEQLFDAARPIVLNGISNFVTRGDLQDRAIVLRLAPIADRKTETELYAEFERKRAGIVGALLDLLARGVRMLPETQLTNPPRMADFATWAVACGLDRFEEAYAGNRQNAIDFLLELDPLANCVMAMALPWKGTATELLDRVGPSTRIANAKALSDELTRLTPQLRTKGIVVERDRTHSEGRLIWIERR